eukprot:GGOE01036706.1.p1 GENE.GGOE01036706.1~~GGOE01036706.1.p1  ORF type:complete len:667 (+),score=68.46 GGOE01036706.1:297-2003(+)
MGAQPIVQNKLNKIWIKHIPQSATIVQLGVYFSSFGKVIDCEIIKDGQGRNTGVGYVCYDSEETAQREVVKQHVFQGQKLVLEPAYKFENQPEFNDILTGNLSFPPLGKAAFASEDDFEMQVNKGRAKADSMPMRRDAGPPMFGTARAIDSPRMMDAGLRPSHVPPMAGAGPLSVGSALGATQRLPLSGGLGVGPGTMDGMRMMQEQGQGVMRGMDVGRRDDGLGMRVQLSADGTRELDLGFRTVSRDVPVEMQGSALPAATSTGQPPLMVAPSSQPIMQSIQPAMAPIRTQPVHPSALYGPKVNTKPPPEPSIQGDNLKSVYVSNLSWWTTDEDVRMMVIEIVGPGIPFNVVFDEHKPNGKSLGSVFIDVQTDQIAQLVIRGLNGKTVNRRELKAELFGQPTDGPSAEHPASSSRAGDTQPGDTAAGQAANAVPVGSKRKPLDDAEQEPTKKRSKAEPVEICKWHLEGGCKYESACPLLHPDLGQKKVSEAKEKSSRSEKKKDEDRERRRTHQPRKEEKKAPRKEGERSSKGERPGSTGARHRHRHEEATEDDSGSEETDAKAKRKR